MAELIQTLTLEQLSSEAHLYDRAVLRTPGIDRFCSSSFWILPAAHHLMSPARSWIHRSANTYVAFAQSDNGTGTQILHPLEAMWALPSPLVGPDPDEVSDTFLSALGADRQWSAVLLTGIAEGSMVWRKLLPELTQRYRLARGPVTRRWVVDLSGGVDGFLSKRSSGFRKNLQKAERRARRFDLAFEVAESTSPEEADESFDRLLAIERRSWKGRHGVGIDTEPMCAFYRDMNRRLVERGARRLLFATFDGRDAAYIFGGILGKTYRGLQFSFDERYRRLSLGNLCQLEEIRRLCQQSIELYDLGTEVAYKKRWGDRVFTTSCVVVHAS